MADVKMPRSIPCRFDAKGWAPCRKPSTNGWCTEHEHAVCVSCGKHAITKCDAQAGGLACGALLCDTCQHGRDGTHITAKAAARAYEEEEAARREGRETARALAERGVPLGLPRHLKELLEGDRSGYELMRCYSLSLKHDLMGYFPAILKGTKKIALVSDAATAFRIWRSLEPRDSMLHPWEHMVNRTVNIAYPMAADHSVDQERVRPLKLFTSEEVEELFTADPKPFAWAPGLIGASTSQRNFEALIAQEAKAMGIVI